MRMNGWRTSSVLSILTLVCLLVFLLPIGADAQNNNQSRCIRKVQMGGGDGAGDGAGSGAGEDDDGEDDDGEDDDGEDDDGEARRSNGYDDSYTDLASVDFGTMLKFVTQNSEGPLFALNCVCNDSLADAGFTDASFVTMPAIYLAVFLYCLGVFVAALQLDKVEDVKVKYLFKAYQFYVSSAAKELQDQETQALAMDLESDVVNSIQETIDEMPGDLDKMVEKRFQEKMAKCQEPPSAKSLEKVRKQAKQGRTWYKSATATIFILFHLVSMILAVVSWFSAPVSCPPGIAQFNYFVGIFMYKPFFIPFGILLLMTYQDMMFPFTGMPENGSGLPDPVAYGVFWFFIIPIMVILGLPMNVLISLLGLYFAPVYVIMFFLSIAISGSMLLLYFILQVLALQLGDGNRWRQYDSKVHPGPPDEEEAQEESGQSQAKDAKPLQESPIDAKSLMEMKAKGCESVDTKDAKVCAHLHKMFDKHDYWMSPGRWIIFTNFFFQPIFFSVMILILLAFIIWYNFPRGRGEIKLKSEEDFDKWMEKKKSQTNGLMGKLQGSMKQGQRQPHEKKERAERSEEVAKEDDGPAKEKKKEDKKHSEKEKKKEDKKHSEEKESVTVHGAGMGKDHKDKASAEKEKKKEDKKHREEVAREDDGPAKEEKKEDKKHSEKEKKAGMGKDHKDEKASAEKNEKKKEDKKHSEEVAREADGPAKEEKKEEKKHSEKESKKKEKKEKKADEQPGLQWKDVGSEKPKNGVEITSDELKKALKARLDKLPRAPPKKASHKDKNAKNKPKIIITLSEKECQKIKNWQLIDCQYDSYIKVRHTYFATISEPGADAEERMIILKKLWLQGQNAKKYRLARQKVRCGTADQSELEDACKIVAQDNLSHERDSIDLKDLANSVGMPFKALAVIKRVLDLIFVDPETMFQAMCSCDETAVLAAKEAADLFKDPLRKWEKLDKQPVGLKWKDVGPDKPIGSGDQDEIKTTEGEDAVHLRKKLQERLEFTQKELDNILILKGFLWGVRKQLKPLSWNSYIKVDDKYYQPVVTQLSTGTAITNAKLAEALMKKAKAPDAGGELRFVTFTKEEWVGFNESDKCDDCYIVTQDGSVWKPAAAQYSGPLVDGLDLVQIVQAEWPIEDFVFMRDWTGFAKWLGREVRWRTTKMSFMQKITFLNTGAAVAWRYSLNTIAFEKDKYVTKGGKVPNILPPCMDSKTTFTTLQKVMIVYLLSVLVWGSLSFGQILAGFSWMEVAGGSLRWWYPGGFPTMLKFTFSWPSMPALPVAQFSFSVSFGVASLQGVVLFIQALFDTRFSLSSVFKSAAEQIGVPDPELGPPSAETAAGVAGAGGLMDALPLKEIAIDMLIKYMEKEKTLEEDPLKKYNLKPEDVRVVLNAIDLEVLQELAASLSTDPLSLKDKLIELMCATGGPIAVKLILVALRPHLQPRLVKIGLDSDSWEDALPLLASALTLACAGENSPIFQKAQECLTGGASTIEDFVDEIKTQLISDHTEALLKILMKILRPKLEPRVKQEGLTWTEVTEAITKIKCEDVLECAQSVQENWQEGIEAIMAKLEEVAAPIALKIAIFRARKVLEPQVAKFLSNYKMEGMEGSNLNFAEVVSWDDMVSVIAASEITVDDVKKALLESDINDIVTKLENALKANAEPLLKKMLFALLRTKAEPRLKEHGVTWAEFTEVMEKISLDEMKKYAAEYAETGELEHIMKKLADVGGPIALKIAIANARGVLEPKIKDWLSNYKMEGLNSNSAGVDVKWEDIMSVITASEITVDDVKKAIDGDMNGIVTKLENALKANADLLLKKMLFALLRTKAEPRLKEHGVTWAEFTEVMEKISLADLKRLAEKAEMEHIMKKLADVGGPIALKIAIANARGVLEPKIKEVLESKIKDWLSSDKMEGLNSNSAGVDVKWEDVMSVITASQITVDDVKKAIDGDINGIVTKLENVLKANADPLLKKMLFALMRTKAEPPLKEHGVTWAEFTEVMEKISLDEMKKYAAEFAEKGELEPIVKELAKGGGAIVLKSAIFNARTVLEPCLKNVKLPGTGITLDGAAWEDVVGVILASNVTVADLQTCAKNTNAKPIQDKLLGSLGDATEPVVKKMVMAQMRKTLEPRIKEKKGLAWEDAAPVIEALPVETLKDCAEKAQWEPILEKLDCQPCNVIRAARRSTRLGSTPPGSCACRIC